MKILITFLTLLLLVVLNLSCARTVGKPLETFSLKFDITFKNPMDPSHFNYLIVFSRNSTPNIQPFSSVISTDYCPLPGFEVDPTKAGSTAVNTLGHYYDTFFGTWSEYIIVRENDSGADVAQLIQSDPTETFFTIPTNSLDYEQDYGFSYSLSTSTKLTLVFDVSMLGLEEDDTLYFSIITTGRDFGIYDDVGDFRHTISQTYSIIIKSQQLQENTENIPGFIHNNYDPAIITSWRVDVF